MSKQSSVQWLFQQLWDTPKDKLDWQSIFLMAHQMHQEEIVDSYDGVMFDDYGRMLNGKQYYKEKFEDEKEVL